MLLHVEPLLRRLILAILYANVTSSIKPEVDNISQRCQKRTDLAIDVGNVHKNFREERRSVV